MEKFKEILYDIWREACRHIRINESIPVIARMLVPYLPVDQLYILQRDQANARWQIIARGMEEREENSLQGRQHSASDISQFNAWIKKKEILHLSRIPDGEINLSLIFGFTEKGRDILVSPAGTLSNMLILILSKRDHLFEDQHVRMFKHLIEPLTIAIVNDRHIHEIETLRQAAEADKKSLLNKLSRKEIADTIIGEEGGLKSVLERISLVANSDVPVLIFGETGTGKELIARTIHKRSGRYAAPFIRVNCGAIPPELLDSQLFGHERGAFTGAVESRKGWFEQADGGTLFLDEVGELPLKAQVRLLRVLQDGWLERVGGKASIHVDVRIVLATHRDLSLMVSEGAFREDLWYRIATFPVVLPPLRERFGDMQALAGHFARRSSIRFGLPLILPDEKDIEILSSYSWPGNIRELASIIDRAALLGNGKSLEISKALGFSTSPGNREKTVDHTGISSESVSTISSLEEVNRRHIQNVLQDCHGRIEGKHGAAELLQIHPSTLRARMRKLGIR